MMNQSEQNATLRNELSDSTVTHALIGLVEPDVGMAQVLSYQVRSLGYRLAWIASNLKEAFALFNQMQPELIFLHLDSTKEEQVVELLEWIHKHSQTRIIFLSKTYALENVKFAHKFHPDAFLLKPLSTELLLLNIELSLANYHQTDFDNHKLMVKVGYKQMVILLNEVEYISSEDNYISYHMNNNKRVIVRATINEIVKRLNPNLFIRIHRGMIVSIKHLTGIEHNKVILGEKSFPISKTYLKSLSNAVESLKKSRRIQSVTIVD